MTPEEIKSRILPGEIKFSTSRSGGPGGQNVNKVNTKVELRFNVQKSLCFSDIEKYKILLFLKKRINSEGELYITSQSERTQLLNKNKVKAKFFRLLASAFAEKKKRKSTMPTPGSNEERLERKRNRGKLKKLRKEKII